MNRTEFTKKCALLWGTNNVQIQDKCKCRASAKTRQGDHLENVETSYFDVFSEQSVLFFFFIFFILKQLFLFEWCYKPEGEERLKRCKGKETLWIWLEG